GVTTRGTRTRTPNSCSFNSPSALRIGRLRASPPSTRQRQRHQNRIMRHSRVVVRGQTSPEQSVSAVAALPTGDGCPAGKRRTSIYLAETHSQPRGREGGSS